LPSRAQQLRDIEAEGQPEFLPAYLVSLENVGDNAHSVCKPLCAPFGFGVE
jgi:hypothetical protein